MLKYLVNQIPINNDPNSQYQFPLGDVGIILTIVIGVGYGCFETLRRTKTQVIQEPTESYFDDSTESRIVNLKIEIKYRDNPFFNRLVLFEYEGTADYKITGFEFNTYPIKVTNELFYEWPEDKRTKIMLIDKSHFKKRGISRFEVRIEYKDLEYRNNITEDINPNKIVITNRNDLPIRNYVFGLPKQTNVDRLRDDPRINDLYPSDHLWIVKINEIPAAGIHEPERMTILI